MTDREAAAAGIAAIGVVTFCNRLSMSCLEKAFISLDGAVVVALQMPTSRMHRNMTSTTDVEEYIQVLFIGRMVKYGKGIVATVRETADNTGSQYLDQSRRLQEIGSLPDGRHP